MGKDNLVIISVIFIRSNVAIKNEYVLFLGMDTLESIPVEWSFEVVVRSCTLVARKLVFALIIYATAALKSRASLVNTIIQNCISLRGEIVRQNLRIFKCWRMKNI